MIVDCFTFNDELDMLELRLRALNDAVGAFVLVEAPVTFQGDPKPLHFDEHRERFSPWLHRIVHVVADELPGGDNPWLRENLQREAMVKGLRQLGLAGIDTVVVADVDEIWDPETLRRPDPFLVLLQTMIVYDWRWQHPEPWDGPTATTWDTIRKCGPSPMTIVRNCRLHHRPPRKRSGWHLSWFGGPDANLSKLDSFSHTEIKERALDGLRSGRFADEGIHVDGVPLVPFAGERPWWAEP